MGLVECTCTEKGQGDFLYTANLYLRCPRRGTRETREVCLINSSTLLRMEEPPGPAPTFLIFMLRLILNEVATPSGPSIFNPT